MQEGRRKSPAAPHRSPPLEAGSAPLSLEGSATNDGNDQLDQLDRSESVGAKHPPQRQTLLREPIDQPAKDMAPERFPLTREAPYLLPTWRAASRLPSPLVHPVRPSRPLGATDASEPGSTTGMEASAVRDWRDGESTSRSLLFREPLFREPLFREPDLLEKAAAVDRFAALTQSAGDGDVTESGDALPDAVVALPLPVPVPAWLHGSEEAEDDGEQAAIQETLSSNETLQVLRERIATQRFTRATALNRAVARQSATDGLSTAAIPLLAVFSLAGGVGKTSLVATLGRALAAAGERVLLADTTPHGLLPFYYGVSDLKPSASRSLLLPSPEGSSAVDLVSLDVLGQARREAQEWLRTELSRNSAQTDRILLDTSMLAPWIAGMLARLNARFLIPMAPDMNSVITLGQVEEYFTILQDDLGQAVQPIYLLNGFDLGQSLHLDVREVLRQKLGERLLPFVVRRSVEVAEALAKGVTVLDYAGESAIAADYRNLAEWVRTLDDSPSGGPKSGQSNGMLRASRQALWSEA